ncbi:molybdopterin synthase catalytic subunit MoaE [Agaribacter marinus]|uniref:Molybdopterin synthase catalytic subunit n=1 Tax=Agaribacter marinus TaxID=1431249 RepID=A0AA37WFX9_9ALTE|nr:molybdopterin synthase catalytic subunit MoaE [Agaribacter marinus]GLR69376.1 molybdopterin guanine dinucleotide biosynthesis protein MoaE [Agaribacter marinus]
MISVQQHDFDVGREYQRLIEKNASDGAVVMFTGLVRDFNQGFNVKGLHIEHYEGMTERALEGIVNQAKERWQLGNVSVIHRVGDLQVNEQIVFVGASSPHREQAFDAAQFIMDYLKTQAPFWKKELTQSGERWVDANIKDTDAANRWQ